MSTSFPLSRGRSNLPSQVKRVLCGSERSQSIPGSAVNLPSVNSQSFDTSGLAAVCPGLLAKADCVSFLNPAPLAPFVYLTKEGMIECSMWVMLNPPLGLITAVTSIPLSTALSLTSSSWCTSLSLTWPFVFLHVAAKTWHQELARHEISFEQCP